jgi:hypothetical protein
MYTKREIGGALGKPLTVGFELTKVQPCPTAPTSFAEQFTKELNKYRSLNDFNR